MFKKIFVFFAVCTAFFAANFFADVSANDTFSGSCGDNAMYTITQNNDDDENPTYTLTISGTGDMDNFEWPNNPGYISYQRNITNVVIESGITYIGEYAFYCFQEIKSVTIPNTVTVIGTYAFYECRSLISVDIPEGVEEIGAGAFAFASALNRVTLPQSLKTIKNSAFIDCSVNSITVPDGTEEIGSYAFSSCRSLTSVILPDTLTSIGNNAFDSCESLSEIVIPESVTNIGNNAFSFCSNLEQIAYPSGLDVSYVGIDGAATHIKYSVSDNSVTVDEIVLGTEQAAADIPAAIGGKPVVKVAESERDKVSQSGHTHNFASGVCTVCNASDPNYVHTETTPTTTEPPITAPPAGESSSESGTTYESTVTTVHAESEMTATTIPTAPPYRPSVPAPAVTAVTTVTTVTTASLDEEIISDGLDDVSVGAPIISDESAIPEKSAGLIVIVSVFFAAAAIFIKKRFF